MSDLLNREIGWLITKEHNELEGIPSRVNWGQLRVHANETEISFGRRPSGKGTLFMDTSLTEHMIPEEARVRWRSFDDDGEACYDGIVNVTWLFDATPDWNDLAYNIDRFNAEDTGAVHVLYSVNDIIKCARTLNRPTWERFAKEHSHAAHLLPDPGLWIQIYADVLPV